MPQEPRSRRPLPHKLTTLWLLKRNGDPAWRYFEWLRLRFLKECLTVKWPILMGGRDPHASYHWLYVMEVLELDRRARVDLLLLAQSGLPGRCEANRILWHLMAEWALEDSYRDLSSKVTNQVSQARKKFDRPPNWHPELLDWSWAFYTDGRLNDPWNPKTVPDVNAPCGPGDAWQNLGQYGESIQPPLCWQMALRPKGS